MITTLFLFTEQKTVMAGRYELYDQHWHMIKDIVSPPQTMGRPRRYDRQMLSGIPWIFCSGAQWRDLSERYGPWKTAYQHFRQWRDDGTFDQVLAHRTTRCGMRLVMPRRRIHRHPQPGLPHQFDRSKYRQHNVVERLFGRLKKKRRLNIRYNKLAISFSAMATLPFERCMKADFSDRT